MPNSNETPSDTKHTNDDYVVIIYNQGEQLQARYELPEPHMELVLNGSDIEQRRIAWSVADEEFEFDGEKVWRKDGASFEQVSFDMVRDRQFFDRRYIVIDDIAPMAWSLYLSAFAVKEQGIIIKFQSEDAMIVRIGASSHELREPYKLGDQSTMSYFGPSDYVRGEDAIIIAGPDMPNWLIDNVSQEISQTMKVVEAGFKVPPVSKPTLYFTTGPKENGYSSKGGQLAEAVMTFRYRGFDFSETNQSLIDRISGTASHEATHLWIGGIYKNIRNSEEPWMHEGGTEYMADRARNNSGEIKVEFEQRLNNCLSNIGSLPLNGFEGSVTGGLPYDCGYVIHVAAETATLDKSQSNIFDIWLHMIESITREDKSYNPSDFLAAVTNLSDTDFDNFARLFLEGGPSGRWQELPQRAQNIGVYLKPTVNEQYAFTGHWLRPLLATNCTGGYGFYNNADAKLLDAENCKAPFKSGLEVISVNDINFLTDAKLALEEVQKTCAEKRDLTLGLKDGTKLPPVSCDLEIPPIAPYFKVTDFPDLPPLSVE